MPSITEKIQENKIIKTLNDLGWKHWHAKGSDFFDKDTNNEASLFNHFVECLEKTNNVKFDKQQKAYIKNKIENIRDDGINTNVQKAFDFLFNPQVIKGDNHEDVITIIDWKNIDKNIFEVSDQLWFNKKYGTDDKEQNYQYRKDLFLLVNGVPLVSIEEKRNDVSLKSAFDQTIRYRDTWVHQHTILNLCLFFVITDECNTLMFGANDSLTHDTWKENDEDQKNNRSIFYWLDEINIRVNDIYKFIKAFLTKSVILDYLAKYVKVDRTKNIIFYAKPHQYHANKKILEHFKNNWKAPAYVWHATASGKTFTMYLAWKNFIHELRADISILLVDRVDLDTQTTKKFTAWECGIMQSVKDIAIRSKNKLIKALKSGQNQIVVTIDIFNNLLKDNIIKGSADTEIPFIKDQKIAIMFDECHRSLFGSQFKNIKKYFTNAALLGFTGTPIFTDNDPDFENITPKLFPTQLHVYGMGQALADGIILPVDYENQDLFRVLDGQETSIQFDDNEKRQIWKTKKYYELLAEDVVKKYHEKSSGFFYTMLAVSSIDAANYIYKIFKGRWNPAVNDFTGGKYPEINIVADFSTDESQINEDATNDFFVSKCDKKAFKRRCITDFGKLMNEAIDENDDASYSRSLIDHSQTNPNSEKNPIHIILVVDKMLTGYDSEYVNALFLDKKLESYRLIQAVSRTTRVSSEEKKTTGFLVAYRTNKDEIEKAFKIYSGDTHVAAQGNVVSNYNERISQINEKISEIKAIVPTPSDMDHPDFFENENKVSSFRKAFTRLKSLMEIFFKYEQHQWKDINITKNEYGEYLSRYINLPIPVPHEKDVDVDISTFAFKQTNTGFIDSKRIWELIQRTKTREDWFNDVRPEIVEIIADSVLAQYTGSKKELYVITYLDNLMQKNNYNINDIREFKLKFKNFLETISENFDQLALNIKNDYQITIDVTDIKEIYAYYRTLPNESDWIEELINKTSLADAGKLFDFFFQIFRSYVDRSEQIKKIIDQIAHQI